MSPLDPGELKNLVYDARWTAVTKIDLDPAAIGTWDDSLARDQRLLVPIDVQALFVAPDGVEPMVRLPSALSDPGGQGAGFPEPFTAGTARPPGVHLHWAPPDALLRGELGATTDNNRLALPALPDRWVVLRLVTPAGATTVSVAGWVLEADRAVRAALADWPAAGATATPSGAPLAPAALTGAAGGAPTWAATYDSVENRFALHDPLDDIALVAPNGVIGNSATYVVAGWWSDVTLDPLDAAHDGGSLDALLHSLGWSAVTPWVDTPAYQRASDEVSRLRSAANLTSASRFATAAGVEPPAAPPIVDQPVTALTTQVRSQLTEQAAATFVTTPWWPHATLLHGSVYGVPVGVLDPSLVVDQRPGADQVRVALGSHDDDVLGALVSSAFPAADDEARGAHGGPARRLHRPAAAPARLARRRRGRGGTRTRRGLRLGARRCQRRRPLRRRRQQRPAHDRPGGPFGGDGGGRERSAGRELVRPGPGRGAPVDAVPRQAGPHHDEPGRRRRERVVGGRGALDRHGAADRRAAGAPLPLPARPHDGRARRGPEPAPRQRRPHIA